MFEPAILAIALLTGGALGIFFFGGLWWTVGRGLASNIPALWFLGSLVVRTGVCLIGFWLVSQGRWERALACGAGFTIARFVVTGIMRRAARPGLVGSKGAEYAD